MTSEESTVLDRVRTANMTVEDIKELQDEMVGETKEIDIPDKSDLFTNKVSVGDEVRGNVPVNGQWVHPLYAKLANMMKNGYSPIICVVGKEGKGKSMAANVMLHYLHNKLNVLRGEYEPKSQVIYRPLEFLMILRDATRTGILFDEANETVNKNNYNSEMNKAVAGALRTQRKRENMYIFVGPELSEFDPRIREKVDIVVEMKGKQFAGVTTYNLKHGKRGREGNNYTWTKYPNWDIPDLPQRYIDEYEEVDNRYKGEYLDELLGKVIDRRMQDLKDSKTASL